MDEQILMFMNFLIKQNKLYKFWFIHQLFVVKINLISHKIAEILVLELLIGSGELKSISLTFLGVIDDPCTVHFLCQGKKMNFFEIAIWLHIILLVLHCLWLEPFGSLLVL